MLFSALRMPGRRSLSQTLQCRLSCVSRFPPPPHTAPERYIREQEPVSQFLPFSEAPPRQALRSRIPRRSPDSESLLRSVMPRGRNRPLLLPESSSYPVRYVSSSVLYYM